MNDQIKNFLENHGFFKYQKVKDYQANLDQQIFKTVGEENGKRLHFRKNFNKAGISHEPYMVLDLGGTNLRLNLCQVSTWQPNIKKQEQYPFYEDKVYTPEILFEDLKKYMDKFLEDPKKIRFIIFSFANAVQPLLRDRQILDGKVLFWGKAHKQDGIIGMNLGEGLEKYLNANGYDVTVHLINDSSLALLSTKTLQGTNHDLLLNLIVGTGTNINVGLIESNSFQLVNMEFGDLDFIPYSDFDEQLDQGSPIPKKFRTEKLFAGAWQHQLFKIMVKKAIEEKIIGTLPEYFKLEESDSAIIEKFLVSPPPDFPYINELKQLWTAINHRGAFICAYSLSRIINYYAEKGLIKYGVTFTEVGSLIEFGEVFKTTLEETLSTLLRENPTTAKYNIEKFFSQCPATDGAIALLSLSEQD